MSIHRNKPDKPKGEVRICTPLIIPEYTYTTPDELKARAQSKAADQWYHEHSRCPKCQSPLNVTSIGCGVPDTVNKGKCTYGTCNWMGPIAEGVAPTLNTLLAELMRYIQHKRSCDVHNIPKSNFQKLKCTCGMDDAKKHMIDAVLTTKRTTT